MSDQRDDCDRFDDWLLAGGAAGDVHVWHGHLESCSECRAQWTAHQLLVATYAGERLPELSARFAAGLRRRLEAAVEVRPLSDWRLAAMAGYALLAAFCLAWLFSRSPLPAIDLSSPWTAVAALFAVPLSLWWTAAATRWLPLQRAKGSRTAAM